MALIEQEPLLRRLRARYSRVEGGGTIYTPSMMLAIRIVEQAPTIDAVPVVHGHWIDLGVENSTGRLFKCSFCGHFWNPNKKDVALKRVDLCPPHCLHCGARMDRGEDDG